LEPSPIVTPSGAMSVAIPVAGGAADLAVSSP
jgi:hypothetical protein